MFESHIKTFKTAHIKVTPKRAAILDLFNQQEKCLTPEDVWSFLKKKFKHFGLPSVYRNLELFEKIGILVKIERGDRKRYYAICREMCQENHGDHHHHHIVCVQCGKVDDFPICQFPQVKSVNGFKILKHILQIEGLCPNCQ